MAIRLLLAHDRPIVVEELSNVLRMTPKMAVVARCTTGADVIDAVRTHRPDVTLISQNLSGRSGIQLLRDLLEQGVETKTVLLMEGSDDEVVLEALRLGVRGIMLMELTPQLLVQCIRKVAAGERWLERRSAARLIELLVRWDEEPIGVADMTSREDASSRPAERRQDDRRSERAH
jgi:DNA-binding NarL/FixJ family response regulator